MATSLNKTKAQNFQKGFIQIPIILYVLAGIFLVGGGSYVGVKNYSESKIEEEKKEEIINTINTEKETEVNENNVNLVTEETNLNNIIPDQSKEIVSKVAIDTTTKTDTEKSLNNTLTQEYRDKIISAITEVIDRRQKTIDSLDKRKKSLNSSSYIEEYADLFLLIDRTKEVFIKDIEFGEILIKAVVSAKDTDHDAFLEAFSIFGKTIKDTDDDTLTMISNINSIQEISDNIIEERIRLEVIAELREEYGISEYSSTNYSEEMSALEDERKTIEKELDDYMQKQIDYQKELKEKDGSRIKNVLIGIIIFN